MAMNYGSCSPSTSLTLYVSDLLGSYHLTVRSSSDQRYRYCHHMPGAAKSVDHLPSAIAPEAESRRAARARLGRDSAHSTLALMVPSTTNLPEAVQVVLRSPTIEVYPTTEGIV